MCETYAQPELLCIPNLAIRVAQPSPGLKQDRQAATQASMFVRNLQAGELFTQSQHYRGGQASRSSPLRLLPTKFDVLDISQELSLSHRYDLGVL